MSDNDGVHAIVGFRLQRNFALLILLESWEELQDKKYFISIEHHDDFLFCYQTENGLVSSISTYQSKKKSSGDWTLNKDFLEILKKITELAKNLYEDEIEKTSDYTHKLHFISNSPTSFSDRSKDIPNIKVHEENKQVKFTELDTFYKNKIKNGINDLTIGAEQLQELENLIFLYRDLPRTVKYQKNLLIGSFFEIFGDKVVDHKASIEVLESLFSEIETIFNQGKKAKLLDKSKQVTSEQINNAINIITTKQKAFKLWRASKEDIVRIFHLPMRQQKKFEQAFENSFDLFKDLKQSEHQKIFNFLKNHMNIFDMYLSDKDCIEAFYNKYKTEFNSQLSEIDIKAAVFAAYIELKEQL